MCFEEWREAMHVPDLPSNHCVCYACAQSKLFCGDGTPLLEECIKALFEGRASEADSTSACLDALFEAASDEELARIEQAAAPNSPSALASRRANGVVPTVDLTAHEPPAVHVTAGTFDSNATPDGEEPLLDSVSPAAVGLCVPGSDGPAALGEGTQSVLPAWPWGLPSAPAVRAQSDLPETTDGGTPSAAPGGTPSAAPGGTPSAVLGEGAISPLAPDAALGEGTREGTPSDLPPAPDVGALSDLPETTEGHTSTATPDEGTRCSLDGTDGIVWKVIGTKIAVVFDDCRTRTSEGWVVCEQAEWRERAGPASTGDGICMVLSDRTESNAKLPCAFLKQPFASPSESSWQAFAAYEPAPIDSSPSKPNDWAPAPVAFPVRQGTPVQCRQPFVSIPKGKTTVQPSTEPALLHVCGVLIGNEFNAKKNKNEMRRWVAGVYALGQQAEEEVMAPLSAILELENLPAVLDEVRVACIWSSLPVFAYSGFVCPHGITCAVQICMPLSLLLYAGEMPKRVRVGTNGPKALYP